MKTVCFRGNGVTLVATYYLAIILMKGSSMGLEKEFGESPLLLPVATIFRPDGLGLGHRGSKGQHQGIL